LAVLILILFWIGFLAIAWPRGRGYRDKALGSNTLQLLTRFRLRCGGWWPDREEDESCKIFGIPGI